MQQFPSTYTSSFASCIMTTCFLILSQKMSLISIDPTLRNAITLKLCHFCCLLFKRKENKQKVEYTIHIVFENIKTHCTKTSASWSMHIEASLSNLVQFLAEHGATSELHYFSHCHIFHLTTTNYQKSSMQLTGPKMCQSWLIFWTHCSSSV